MQKNLIKELTPKKNLVENIIVVFTVVLLRAIVNSICFLLLLYHEEISRT